MISCTYNANGIIVFVRYDVCIKMYDNSSSEEEKHEKDNTYRVAGRNSDVPRCVMVSHDWSDPAPKYR